MSRFPHQFSVKDFGHPFLWGVAIAAAQNEGAWNEDGLVVSGIF